MNISAIKVAIVFYIALTQGPGLNKYLNNIMVSLITIKAAKIVKVIYRSLVGCELSKKYLRREIIPTMTIGLTILKVSLKNNAFSPTSFMIFFLIIFSRKNAKLIAENITAS